MSGKKQYKYQLKDSNLQKWIHILFPKNSQFYLFETGNAALCTIVMLCETAKYTV